jgi:hypothetical protein
MKGFFLFLLTGNIAAAQDFVLNSSRYVDLNSRSTSRTNSVIYIDSSRITIEQNGTNLYLDIKEQRRREDYFFYTVINFEDKEYQVVFSPGQMSFEYLAGEFRLRFLIDSIRQESYESEEAGEEILAAADSLAEDSTAITVVEDTKIYLSAELPPEFPGGPEALKSWIIENTRYPAAAKREKIIGLVEVTAVVEKDGSLSDVRVKRDIGGGCGDEAVRVVNTMPAWIPGQIKNEDKRVKTTIRVFFPPK